MVAAVSSTLLAVSVYGPERGWGNSTTLTYLGAGILLALIFLVWEGKAKEPIIPLSLFKNHTFSLTSALGFIIGAGMFGAIVMLPLYLQVVKGDTATEAGLKLIPFMLGIVSTSIYSGKAITKHGYYKRFPIIGTAVMTVGILLMATLNTTTPFWQLSIYAILVGAGLGLSMQTIVIALQNSVDFKDMGVATSSNTFFRSLGSVFGTALFGAILSNRLGHYLIVGRDELAASNPTAALSLNSSDIEKLKQNTSVIAQLPPEAQTTALNAFVNSFQVVFLVAAPITAFGFLLALFLRETPLRTNKDYAAAREESAGEAIG
jgi:MFS family permease